MSALLELEDALLEAGLSEDEVDLLICRFLEEEAFDYVKCIEEFGTSDEIKRIRKASQDAKKWA